MRIIQITLYAFTELSEAVQEGIVKEWRSNDSFPWDEEWRDSLNAFKERAVHKPLDLSALIRDCQECKLTGYAGDTCFTQPLIDGAGEPWSLVYTAAFLAWQNGYQADIDHWYSYEAIRAELAESDHEFLVDGHLWLGTIGEAEVRSE